MASELFELVARNFCVGEALSIPVLRGSWHAAKQPLIKAVLGRIVKDEAAHGQFGWMFLDWADDQLTPANRDTLAACAQQVIDAVTARWTSVEPQGSRDADTLGWMESASYLDLARRSLAVAVIAPLRARGISVTASRPIPGRGDLL